MKNMSFEDIERARIVLGLGERATLREIKEAYRKMSKKYHPDKGEGNEERMKEINEAYEILTEFCECYSFPLTRKRLEEEKDTYSKYIESFLKDWMWTSKTIKGGENDDYSGI